MVAGLAAYLRALPSKWKTDLEDPRLLKALIKVLQRQIPPFPNQPAAANAKRKVPTVWNGQVFDKSCLVDSGTKFPGDSACPNIDDIYKPEADKAVFSPGGNDNGGTGIVFQPGPPSPTCTAGCGKLCTGFFCASNPTGNPNAPPSSSGGPLPTLTSGPSGCGPSQTPSPVQVCNGSGNRRVCVTSTTCAAIPKPTTTILPPNNPPATPSPSPKPQSAFILIALEEMLNYGYFGGTWARAWNVYAGKLGDAVIMCEDRYIYSENTSSGTAFTSGFAPSLGPFTVPGGFKCTYKGTEDRLGVLQCDGIENMWCEKVDKKEGCGSLYNPVYIAAVACSW